MASNSSIFGPQLNDLLVSVGMEIRQAEHKNGPFHSAHEGWAVLLEEVDELWDEVKLKRELRSKERMHAEAIQVASSAIRFAMDICGEKK